MEELKVSVIQTVGKIDCNFEEIKEALAVQMSAYDGITVSEDEIPAAKKELATLRKIRKAVDDKRKEVKKEFCEPLDEFEGKVKELLAEIDRPIGLIDSQVKMFDEEKKVKKQEHIKELYEANIQGLDEFLPFDRIMSANPKWTNASVKDTDIIFDLNAMVLKVQKDLEAIKALGSEIEDDVITTYKNSGNDLSAAITRNSQYINDKNRIVEQVKEETPTPDFKWDDKAADKQYEDSVSQTKMVRFIVSEVDAEQVRQLLTNAGIIFGEE